MQGRGRMPAQVSQPIMQTAVDHTQTHPAERHLGGRGEVGVISDEMDGESQVAVVGIYNEGDGGHRWLTAAVAEQPPNLLASACHDAGRSANGRGTCLPDSRRRPWFSALPLRRPPALITNAGRSRGQPLIDVVAPPADGARAQLDRGGEQVGFPQPHDPCARPRNSHALEIGKVEQDVWWWIGQRGLRR